MVDSFVCGFFPGEGEIIGGFGGFKGVPCSCGSGFGLVVSRLDDVCGCQQVLKVVLDDVEDPLGICVGHFRGRVLDCS